LWESFVCSVLYSKKGMPRPCQHRLRAAEIAAFRKLTFADEPSEHEQRSFCRAVRILEPELRRTVRELYSSYTYTDSDRVHPFFPSTSANYINSRSLAGAVGAILEHPSLLKGLKTRDYLVELRRESSLDSPDVGALVLDDSELQRQFITLYYRMVSEALQESSDAKLLALPESLKTRVISKGPPLKYTVLKPLQHFLHGVLRRHPTFQLVGKPVSSQIISDILIGGRGDLIDDEFFVSVDYTDATNEMYSLFSEIVVEELCDTLHLTVEERRLFLESMTEHNIHLDPSDLDNLELSGLQKRGQLMGSIVSFPILCIVNAALCRYALEVPINRRSLLKDLPLLVNGDDAVFRTVQTGYNAWSDISPGVGLVPSVGKVYLSREFLNINSTTYDYHSGGYSRKAFRDQLNFFSLVPYVNLGLLLGIKRSGTGSNSTRDFSFSAIAHKLVNGAPSLLRERLLGQYIWFNQHLFPNNVPWFLPVQFGGLGLPTVGTYQLRDEDLRWLAKYQSMNDAPELPSFPVSKDWKVWQYATALAKPLFREVGVNFKNLPDLKRKDALSLNDLYGRLAVTSLFRSESLQDLFTPSQKIQGEVQGQRLSHAVARFYHRLQRFWADLRSRPGGLPSFFGKIDVIPADANRIPVLLETLDSFVAPPSYEEFNTFYGV
jgi:hypothetical protein